jgi:RNA polymerase sigma factor (sigma-70 family)
VSDLNLTIERLLESLPEEERLILTLYFRAEKSSAEIADLLGVPEQVVARMVSVSKTKLITMLALGK